MTTRKSSSFLLFTYGAHMESARMARLSPDSEPMGIARADGFRLDFTDQGWANVKPEPGAAVWGIMWLVPANAMSALDEWARSRGLQRAVLFVVSPAGPRVPATAYFDSSVGSGLPNQDDLERLIAAARGARLSPVYLAELETWRTRILEDSH